MGSTHECLWSGSLQGQAGEELLLCCSGGEGNAVAQVWREESNPGSSKTWCHLPGELSEEPRCKRWLCLIQEQGHAHWHHMLHVGALHAPTGSECLSPPRGLAALSVVCSGTVWWCDPGHDRCENSSAVAVTRSWGSSAVFGLRPLLLAFAGLYSRDGSTWPWAMLTLTDGLLCLSLELPPDHGHDWWLLVGGWPCLSSLHSYRFCCSRFKIHSVSKRAFSLHGISKCLEINCVWQLYKCN